MSPYLYRRLKRDKLARLRQRAGVAHEPQIRRAQSVAPRAQPGICRPTAPRAVESSPAVTTTSSTYRELDQRTADGLAVTLEWNPVTDVVRVVVVDREREAVTFPVSAADASDAFVHPFIYAGRAVCEVV
jgi:hypothetical protein